MADLIGHTDWTTGSPAWPAGAQPGHLGLLVLSSKSAAAAVAPPGWTSFGVENFDSWVMFEYLDNRQVVTMYQPGSRSSRRVRIAAKFLTAADLAAPAWPGASSADSPRAALTVIGDTGGIGVVRSGTMAAPVKAGGAIWLFYPTTTHASTSTHPDGVTTLGGSTRLATTGYKPYGGDYQYTNHDGHTGWAQATTDGTLGDPGNRAKAVTLELLPPVAPLAPQLTAPAEGDVSAGVDLEYAFVHRPVLSGGYPDARQVQVAIDDGGELDWQWYDPATGTLSATEVVMLGSATSGVIDGDLLVSGDRVMVRVMTREGLDGRWSSWSLPRSVPVVTPPSVVVTGPTGTVTDDWTPTLTWDGTTPQGEQVAFHARVTVDGVEVFNSGPMAGSAEEFTVPVLDWVQDSQPVGHVRIRQTGGSWSDWDSTTWTMSWTLPDAPTVIAVPGEYGVDVTVEGADTGDEVELERLDPGHTWRLVSTILVDDPNPTLPDVTAPYGQDVVYRARVKASLDGASLDSDWSDWQNMDPVASTYTGAVLIDATRPLTSWLPVSWSGDDPRPSGQERVIWRGLGDDDMSMMLGRYNGQSGTWRFTARTHQEREDLREMLGRPHRLMLRQSAEMQLGPDGKRSRVDNGLVTFLVTDGPRVARIARTGIAERWLEVDWTEASPVRPVERQRTGGVIDLTGAMIEPGPGGTILVTVPVEG